MAGKTLMKSGFALVSTVMVMTLLVLVALGMISLATIETRQSVDGLHQEIARSNARMALMIALGELQKQTGPDQRVTACAAVLEDAAGSMTLANRNWLGVWKTSYQAGGREWPLIGKVSSEVPGAPYTIQGAYQDLRHSIAGLSNGAWKQKHAQSWLVSKRIEVADPARVLDENSGDVVEMLGRGTLGTTMNLDQFKKHRVLVEKVDVAVGNHSGAYAWYICDNNQKASLDPHFQVTHAQAAMEAAPRSNPALVKRAGGELPYKSFVADAIPDVGKMISYATAPLSQANPEAIKKALGEDYHHFTSYSPGLFVNTLTGGLRRDLTPLLLAGKGIPELNFSLAGGSDTRVFSSSYPVIPGPEHGVLGPSFGALRNWAQHKYTDLTEAETVFSAAAKRMRPTSHWPHGISDGACADAAQWAEHAPKIHPVMTECRWHYYFSHHNKRIRTHIIPRVCLWNPYNRSLKTPALSVLMPNPYYGVKHGMHFFPDEEHVEEDLKTKNIDVFNAWVQKGAYVGGNVYKIRTNPFPPRRYLAFRLEETTLEAGQCQVFSPKVIIADLTSGGIKLQRYKLDAVSGNVLSPSSIQGGDHYFYDHDASVSYEIQTPGWRKIHSYRDLVDFSRIADYQPALDLQTDGKVENFPFVLKVGAAATLDDLYTSDAHPTLQLINNGAGGVKHTKTFHCLGLYWGSANQKDISFGYLQSFDEAPTKNAPCTHQVGGKLLWLNETVGEANPYNRSPHRHGTSSKERWGEDHMVYNVCPVANWNVRAQLVSRSPVSQCANKWYMNSTGPWLLQFVPYRPLDANDMPALSGNVFVKNPFGLAVDFSTSPNVVLFDLPSEDYGVISLASLRHAMLSPYSWSPSYLVGHSLRDMHAPAEATAHAVSLEALADEVVPTRWDYLIGEASGNELGHGASCTATDSQGLLQIGGQFVTRVVGDEMHSSANEVMAYDIAYEVNHNLWDDYFLSGMPLSEHTDRFDWNPDEGKALWNRRYQFNRDSGESLNEVMKILAGPEGLNTAFLRNAAFLKNRSAFNVNSTSVEAWTAFLSGTLGIKRPLASGELGDGVVSFARYRKPDGIASTGNACLDDWGGWTGARQLTGDEVRMLAAKIVEQVKKRGPFVSVADFVNRRLVSDQDETSRMGTVDAAIQASGLNRNFDSDGAYLSTTVNAGASTDAPDNNMETFQSGYRYLKNDRWTTAQPSSKAWGMPGFLTQGDVLEPLAASLSVRGDTFTIRAYGESSENGELKGRAWIEATVERSPNYLKHRAFGDDAGAGGNAPTDSPQSIDHATGAYEDGDLDEVNKKFGRRYQIKSLRWLSPEEI